VVVVVEAATGVGAEMAAAAEAAAKVEVVAEAAVAEAGKRLHLRVLRRLGAYGGRPERGRGWWRSWARGVVAAVQEAVEVEAEVPELEKQSLEACGAKQVQQRS